MHTSCAWVLLLAVSVIGGCGAGGQKQPVEPSKNAVGSLTGTEVKPDLTEVGAPKDVIALARVERLENASATIARWMSMPFDLRMLDALGPGLSRALDANAPLEAVVTLAEGGDTEISQPHAVFSAGLTSIDAGRTLFDKFGRKLEDLAPGIWITTDDSPIACAVAPALGRASARLVCGARRVDIENLLPYATRGLPLLAMGPADAHLEFRLAPVRERYAQRLKQGKAMAVPLALAWLGLSDTRISRPLTDILYALGDEVVDVVEDLDRISVDAQFASAPERLDLSTRLTFTRARSWVAQAIADSAKRAAPPPAAFFDLPSDSGLASYVVPSNPRMLDTIAHRLEALLDGVLAHFEVNQKLREDVVRALDQYASHSWGGACGEGAPAPTEPRKNDDEAGVFSTINAWQVCAYDSRPAAILGNLLDTGARLVADKKAKELLGERSFAVRRRPAGAGLPAGSSVYEIKINGAAFEAAVAKWGAKSSARSEKKPATADPSKIGTLYIYIVPDASRTWVGSGTDPKAIEAHLVAARKAGGQGHLSTADLAWLRETPAVGGGFVSMAHIGAMVAARGGKKGLSKSRVDEVFAVAPHHGRTPIPFTIEVHGSSGAPELTLNTRLDKALFEDLAAMSGQALFRATK